MHTRKLGAAAILCMAVVPPALADISFSERFYDIEFTLIDLRPDNGKPTWIEFESAGGYRWSADYFRPATGPGDHRLSGSASAQSGGATEPFAGSILGEPGEAHAAVTFDQGTGYLSSVEISATAYTTGLNVDNPRRIVATGFRGDGLRFSLSPHTLLVVTGKTQGGLTRVDVPPGFRGGDSSGFLHLGIGAIDDAGARQHWSVTYGSSWPTYPSRYSVNRSVSQYIPDRPFALYASHEGPGVAHGYIGLEGYARAAVTVPEPSALLLGAFGLPLVIGARRLRSRKPLV